MLRIHSRCKASVFLKDGGRRPPMHPLPQGERERKESPPQSPRTINLQRRVAFTSFARVELGCGQSLTKLETNDEPSPCAKGLGGLGALPAVHATGNCRGRHTLELRRRRRPGEMGRSRCRQ